jgi:hypothetical protein
VLREQARWSVVLSRTIVDDVDVWIDRLGSLGSVCLHVRSRSENGGRRWLVLEAERPNFRRAKAASVERINAPTKSKAKASSI